MNRIFFQVFRRETLKINKYNVCMTKLTQKQCGWQSIWFCLRSYRCNEINYDVVSRLIEAVVAFSLPVEPIPHNFFALVHWLSDEHNCQLTVAIFLCDARLNSPLRCFAMYFQFEFWAQFTLDFYFEFCSISFKLCRFFNFKCLSGKRLCNNDENFLFLRQITLL